MKRTLTVDEKAARQDTRIFLGLALLILLVVTLVGYLLFRMVGLDIGWDLVERTRLSTPAGRPF